MANNYFGGFERALERSIPLVIQSRRLDEMKRQFNQRYDLNVAQLMQDAQEAKDQILADQLKSRATYWTDMIQKAIDAGDEGTLKFVNENAPPDIRALLGSIPQQGAPQEPDSLKAMAVEAFRRGDMEEFNRINKAMQSMTPTSATPAYTPIGTSEGYFSFDQRRGTAAPLEGVEGSPLLPTAGDLNLIRNRERVKKEGQFEAEKAESFPKVRNSMNSLNRQWGLVEKKIDEALQEINPWTTGLGAWVSVVPATAQKDLRETLETIKANIGFDKLQDMRANSPTGGALGQVSEFENRLLQAVQGSLDQSQSAAQLKENLTEVKRLLQLTREYQNSIFKADYSDFIENNNDNKNGPQTADEYLESIGIKNAPSE